MPTLAWCPRKPGRGTAQIVLAGVCVSSELGLKGRFCQPGPRAREPDWSRDRWPWKGHSMGMSAAMN